MRKPFLLIAAVAAGITANAQWTSISSSATDKLHAIHFFDANTGICSGYSPQQVTSNGGTSWTNVPIAGMNDYSFVTNGTTGYAAGSVGNSMKKTTNGGASWTNITPPTSNSLWAVATVDANTAYFVGTGGVLWKTANGGASVSVLNPGTTDQMTDIVFTSATTGMFVTQLGGIKRTTNGGTSWAQVYSPAIGVLMTEMHFTDANTGYVCGSKGTIAKTTDGGITWTNLNSGSTTAAFQGIHFFDANNGIVVGLSGIVSLTHDGGATWCTQTVSSQHLRDVRMLSANSAVVVGENGTILKNTNITCTSLGIEETNDQPEISIFPTLLDDVLNITANKLESAVLYNAAGEIAKTVTADSDSIVVDCSELPAGLYIVRISTARGTQSRKVIKN